MQRFAIKNEVNLLRNLQFQTMRLLPVIALTFTIFSLISCQDQDSAPRGKSSHGHDQNMIRFLKDWGVDLKDTAYAYVSIESDFVSAFSFDVPKRADDAVKRGDEIMYNLYQSTGDRLEYSGIAVLSSRYTDDSRNQFAKYSSRTSPGAGFEIIINENDDTATLKFLQKELVFGLRDDIIMKRVK